MTVPTGAAAGGTGLDAFLQAESDAELREFRQLMGGTGWAAKVPHADGAVFLHLREAGYQLAQQVLDALELGWSALPDDPGHPMDIAAAGFFAHLTLVNRSSTLFVRDWRASDRSYDFLLGLASDMEDLWMPRFSTRDLLSKRFPPEFKGILWPRLEVPPGGRDERVLRFRPNNTSQGVRSHPSHIEFLSVTVPVRFGAGFLSGVDAPVPVAFPFINPDQPRNNARAEVGLRFRAAPAPGTFAVIPPLQIFRSATDVWVTPGFTVLPGGSHRDVAVPVVRSTPGASGQAPGTALVWAPSAAGFRFPPRTDVRLATAPSGGGALAAIEGWAPYSFKKEKAARAAWEALPVEEKIRQTVPALGSESWEARVEALHGLGRLGDDRALPAILEMFDDKHPMVSGSARAAYRAIVGMTYEQHEANKAAKRAQEEYFIDLAKKYGSVTNLTIQDSVLQSTTINLGGAQGSVQVLVKDSVLTGTAIGKKEGDR